MEKRNKLFTLGLVVAAIVTLTSVTMASASVFPGRGEKAKQNFDPANLPAEAQAHFTEMKAQQEKMQTIMDNKDYTAWQALMQERLNNSPIVKTMDVVNENNFSKFTEMHNLMQEGKTDEANAIRQELGLPDRGEGMGKGMGFGRGMHGGRGMMRGQNTTDNTTSQE
ncbi:MAG: hypothetical protein WA057_02120 [Candidatus Magasanikiibacteriota bacterium]